MSVNVVNNDGSLSRVAGGTLYADAPIGAILPYGGTTAPSGWLLCRGQEVSRTDYPELFAVIGTAFGSNSSTTFQIPDLREATTKGVGLSGKGDQSSGNHYDYDDGGVELGEFIENRIRSHYHNVYVRDTGHIHGILYEHGQFVPGAYGFMSPYVSQSESAATTSSKSNIEVNQTPSFNGLANATGYNGSQTAEVKAIGVNYIIKAKHTSVPTDFADSLIGYLGKETNYNLYPWSHARTVETSDDNQDITIERDGWYSIDYTLSSGTDTTHTFTFRDFDSQGEVHTVMRAIYDKSGTFRQTFLVPLKAGTYRYSHGGIGTLSVYMNRRDFA